PLGSSTAAASAPGAWRELVPRCAPPWGGEAHPARTLARVVVHRIGANPRRVGTDASADRRWVTRQRDRLPLAPRRGRAPFARSKTLQHRASRVVSREGTSVHLTGYINGVNLDCESLVLWSRRHG